MARSWQENHQTDAQLGRALSLSISSQILCVRYQSIVRGIHKVSFLSSDTKRYPFGKAYCDRSGGDTSFPC